MQDHAGYQINLVMIHFTLWLAAHAPNLAQYANLSGLTRFAKRELSTYLSWSIKKHNDCNHANMFPGRSSPDSYTVLLSSITCHVVLIVCQLSFALHFYYFLKLLNDGEKNLAPCNSGPSLSLSGAV